MPRCGRRSVRVRRLPRRPWPWRGRNRTANQRRRVAPDIMSPRRRCAYQRGATEIRAQGHYGGLPVLVLGRDRHRQGCDGAGLYAAQPSGLVVGSVAIELRGHVLKSLIGGRDYEEEAFTGARRGSAQQGRSNDQQRRPVPRRSASMPLHHCRPRLLRVLETGGQPPQGQHHAAEVDFQLVCATAWDVELRRSGEGASGATCTTRSTPSCWAALPLRLHAPGRWPVPS